MILSIKFSVCKQGKNHSNQKVVWSSYKDNLNNLKIVFSIGQL